MQALDLESAEVILQDAEAIDDELGRAWCYFQEDEQYANFCKVFDRENFTHYDTFSDEWVEMDKDANNAAMKKALRKVNVPELLKFVFDFGRLVGRAEYTILKES